MVSNALSDFQSDASAGAKSTDLAGQALAQNVFRTNPSDFLNAIQDMTSKSGSSDFLQPMTLFGGQSGSSERGSSSSYVSPTDAGSSIAFTTDGKNLTSLALPTDNQSTSLHNAYPSEGNSGQTSNLPESNSGQSVGSSESTSGQSSIPSETNSGQTAALPESSSSGLESNAGQTAVSPESSSGQTDSSLTPNSSFDQMPQINQSNNNNNSEISQLENQILTDMQDLIQLLENKWQPQPSPEPSPEPNPEPNPEPTPTPLPEPGPLQGDVASMTPPSQNSKEISYTTTDGQTKTAPLPSTFDGTGTYTLFSDGVLGYSPAYKEGGEEYLDDTKNPPAWIDYDGPNTPRPSGEVVQSWPVDQPPAQPTGGDVQRIFPPDVNATNLSIQNSEGSWQTIPVPPDYNGTGEFSVYQNGVLGYSGPPGESGGQYYYDQAINPPGWINNDGPDPGPNAPSGGVKYSVSPSDYAPGTN